MVLPARVGDGYRNRFLMTPANSDKHLVEMGTEKSLRAGSPARDNWVKAVVVVFVGLLNHSCMVHSS